MKEVLRVKNDSKDYLFVFVPPKILRMKLQITKIGKGRETGWRKQVLRGNGHIQI